MGSDTMNLTELTNEELLKALETWGMSDDYYTTIQEEIIRRLTRIADREVPE